MDDRPVSDLAVPFCLSTKVESLRLIELPSTVLNEVIKNGNPLSLKSVTSEDGGTALVCTSNQTFEVRQMQSSNLLLLAETTTDSTSSSIGMRAIAQPKGMLELLPKTSDAVGWIHSALPICQIDPDTEQVTVADSATRRSKAEWMASAPFSDGEFEQAWKTTAAFDWRGAAVIAPPVLLVKAWKSVYTAALLRSVDLGQPLEAEQFENAADEDGIPRAVVVSILRRVSLQEDALFSIQQSPLIQWLGEMIIRSQSDVTLEKAAFIQQWQDLLPEKWRGKADLSSIEGKFDTPSASTIKSRDSASTSGAAQATKKPASKWHEKLKASRR